MNNLRWEDNDSGNARISREPHSTDRAFRSADHARANVRRVHNSGITLPETGTYTLVMSEENAAAYRKGIELIHAKLNDLLRKNGVTPIESLGLDFDPNLHQAVIHESSPEHREGEVIGELARGYTIGDRLLRPAMVKVAKP